MVDRKSGREDSGPRAAKSGSIRISSTRRTSEPDKRAPSNDSSSSLNDLIAPVDIGDSAALLRSNTMLLLVAAVCTTAFCLVELISGDFALHGWSFIWLALTSVLAWLAFALRERGGQSAWAAVIGVAALNTLLSFADVSSAMVLAGLLVILMWTSMILRPLHNAAIAGYALLALVIIGDGFALSPAATDTPVATSSAATASAPAQDDRRRHSLPMLFTFLAVPLGLGATLHLRQRTAEGQLLTSVARLEHQRDELKRRLDGKANELELANSQLFEAQKLKMVGTMAAGLAHELNNILTPIRGHAELIAEGEHKLEQTRRYGQRILDSAVAAAQITQALLTYAHKDTFQPVRSNLRQLLQQTILPVLSKTLPNNVMLKTELERSVSVDVDRHLFQQAIVNLVFNACDAMPSGGEIVIGLATSTEYAGEKTEHGEESIDGLERSVIVTVTDNGTGIEEETLQQIFDPFFTTKAVGSGSGLGLAMVMGTVTRHQGRIEVDSEIGVGTTFKIFLPLASTDDRSDAHKPWPVLRGDAKGPVVVVLTEDQDALDEFEELLEATECAPICTNDAKGATPLLTEMGDKVDLLILDLEIEATDGKRLFKTVRELFPELPVILISDQPTDPMVQRMIAAGPTRSVRKPMDSRLFSALLTDLLNPGGDGYRDPFTPVPVNMSSGADVSGPHSRAGA